MESQNYWGKSIEGSSNNNHGGTTIYSKDCPGYQDDVRNNADLVASLSSKSNLTNQGQSYNSAGICANRNSNQQQDQSHNQYQNSSQDFTNSIYDSTLGQQMNAQNDEPVNKGYHLYNTGTTPTNPLTYVAHYINQEQTNYNPSHSVPNQLNTNHGVKYTGIYEHYQISSGAQPFDLFIPVGDNTSNNLSYQNPHHVVQGNHYQPQNPQNFNAGHHNSIDAYPYSGEGRQFSQYPAEVYHNLVQGNHHQSEWQQYHGESYQNPVEGQQNPLEDQQNKVEGQQNPVEDEQNPVEEQQNPVEDQQNPVGDQQNPVEGQHNPVEGQQNPVEGQQNPVEGQQNPVEGQHNPVEDQQNSVEGQQNPVEDQQNPIEGQHNPVEGQQNPVGEQQNPVEGQHISGFKDNIHTVGFDGTTGPVDANVTQEHHQTIRDQPKILPEHQKDLQTFPENLTEDQVTLSYLITLSHILFMKFSLSK